MQQKMAIVHEWIQSRAGSEKVFEALAQAFPDADLYALSQEPDVHLDLGGREVKTSFLNHAKLRNKRGATLPVMPLAWQMMPQHKYDVVVSSHHAFAASNRLAKRDGKHFAYVHTPARYVWNPEIDGRGTSPLLKPVRALLKQIDRSYVDRLHSIAANSESVAGRIATHWKRDASVINPPIDTDYFTMLGTERAALDLPNEFILGFGRWIPYKRMDLVIETAQRANMAVVIAGRGPEAENLRKLAATVNVDVKIIESPTDAEVLELYRRASVLMFPAFEDFGMVPVEAMACGTPVLALNKGGAAETVIDGVTGALVEEQTAEAFAAALPRAIAADANDCRLRAEEFSTTNFMKRVSEWVANG